MLIQLRSTLTLINAHNCVSTGATLVQSNTEELLAAEPQSS